MSAPTGAPGGYPRGGVTPLTKKLLRDLWNARGPVATIALVVALGITGLMGFLGLYRDLRDSRDRYYQDFAYADFQLALRRAPRTALEEIEQLPGLEALEGRISERVSVELAGEPRRLSGRLLSLPEFGDPRVNRLRLLSGRLPRGGGAAEVVLIDDFAKKRGLHPGSVVRLVLHERIQELVVTGVAMGPEFVYLLPEGGGFVPDPANFGIFWARTTLVERLTDMAGAFNDLVGRVGRGTDPRSMTRLLDRMLGRYGVLLASDRSDMASYALLRNEIRLTLVRATTVPSIFLLASALVLNLVLTRLVATQRVQIGTMKALGLSNTRVLLHYVGFAVAICMIGSAAGIWGGFRLNRLLLDLYSRYYHLPFGAARIYPDIAAGGVLAGLLAALAGVTHTCLGVLALTPAEAMRPSPPETRSTTLIPLLSGLPFLWRIAIRNILRHPFRTAVSCLGMSLGIGLMMTSRFFVESITEMNLFRFRVVQRQDLEVLLDEGVSEASLQELRGLPHVQVVEALVRHPFEIDSGRAMRRVEVEGFDRDAWTYRPRHLDGRSLGLPVEGLLLGEKLASVLGVRPGDEVTLRSLKGRRGVHRVRVAGTFRTYLGRSAAAERGWLERLVQEPHGVSSLEVVAPFADHELDRQLARRPGVIKVVRRRERVVAFEENIQGVLEVASNVLVFLAAAIACGMLLNGALVGMAERRTEIAVLRVQGFTLSEVGDLLLYEHVLTGLVGMMVGVPLGYGLVTWVHSFTDTEILRVPFIISRMNVARALLWSASFLLVSHGILRLVLRQERWQASLAVKE